MAPRTGLFVDDQAPKADKWNAHFRWAPHDLMWLVLRLIFDNATPTTGGYVLGGGKCASGGGALQTMVPPVAAVHYDSSIYTATLDGEETVCPLGLALTTAATYVDHSAGDATNDRIDIVTVKSVLGSDRSESVQQKGGTTSPQNTRWGGVTTCQVTEGTPAGSPVAPATPAGETLLYQVLVPALSVASSSFTYTDKRPFAPRSPSKRTDEIEFRKFISTGTTSVWQVFDDTYSVFSMGFNHDALWPTFNRINAPAGEGADTYYPLMCKGGRAWYENVSGDKSTYPDTTAADYSTNRIGPANIATPTVAHGWRISHTTGVAATVTNRISIDVPDRGLTVTAARIQHKVSVVLGGTGAVTAALVYWDESAGTMTRISDVLTLSNTASTFDEAFANVVEKRFSRGDKLFVDVEVAFDTAADSADWSWRGVTVQFTEGRFL